MGSHQTHYSKKFQNSVLRPGDGHWGTWTDWNSCPSKSYARSFRLRFEPNQGPLFDDSGLNSIQIKCVDSDGAETRYDEFNL